MKNKFVSNYKKTESHIIKNGYNMNLLYLTKMLAITCFITSFIWVIVITSGCASSPVLEQSAVIQVYVLQEKESPGTHKIEKKRMPGYYLYAPNIPSLEITHIRRFTFGLEKVPNTIVRIDGRIDRTEIISPCFYIQLAEKDALNINKLTKANVGKYLLISINGEPVSMLKVADEVSGDLLSLICDDNVDKERMKATLKKLKRQ